MVLITHLVRKFQYNTNLTVSMFKNEQLMDDILNYIHSHYNEGSLDKSVAMILVTIPHIQVN